MVTNSTAPLGYAGFVPCANGGLGEVLAGTIDVHTLVTSTLSGGNISGRYQFQPQGASVVGAVTGDTYRATGITQGSFAGSLRSEGYTQTYVNSYQLIGPGPANNLRVQEQAHLTIDPSGDVTASHDNLSIECM